MFDLLRYETVVNIMKESNVRNLTKTLAVVSLLAPASAQSLGIGDIKLHSALNQNLNAEIALIVSAGEDVSDIKVSLAPSSKFDEAGVAWSYFLSKIKFEPVVKSNGSVVVKLTSREALKEPFLDFLIQVSWPKGNLYREFTVLVDPPAVYKQPSIPVQTAPEVEPEPEPELAYVPERRTARSRIAEETSAEEMPRAEQHSSQVPSNREPGTGTVTTRKNDTLWNVADRFSRQENVSVEQMMIAIYDKNPHAFFKKNVNALMAGKRLSIPDRQVALKLSRRQALDEFSRQREAWVNQTAPQNPEALAENSADAEKQLALVAPSEAEVNGNAVVTPSADKKDKSNNDSGEKTAEIQAIQNKVAELEKQLAVMQQLIALKDQQLATLQNQAPAAAEVIKPAEVKKPEPATVTEPVAEQPPVKPEVPVTPPVAEPVPQPAEQTAKEQPPVVPVAPEVKATPPVTQPVPAEVPVTAEAKKPAPPKVAQPVKPSSKAGVSDSTMDTYYLTVAGLGSVALSLLGWLWWRKRKIEEETDTDSMFASSSAIIVPDADENIVQTTKSAGFYDVDSLGESSFLSEFTTSDFDVFDTAHGEIDPISEADVYLAYGRYQQAEELIRQAIKDQPNDDECKLKLLEIFYANENKTAFEAYAKELAEAGKNFETDFWVKVADMGKDICPDSSLFTGGAVASMAAEVALPATKANKVVVDKEVESNSDYMDDMDLDLDMVSFDDQPVDSHTIDDEEEFSLSSLDVAKEKTTEQPKDSNSIEFDLSEFSAKTKKIEPSFESSIDDSDIETFAFDFDTEPKPTDSKPASKIELKKTPEELDDFHDLDMSAATAVASAAKESNGFDSDFDFDFDFDSSAFGSGSSLSDTDTGFDIADLTDMDELETKLDLAKAYVDMGDISAAKDIANEILSKGSAEQKKSAQLLLNEIS